MYPVEGHTLVGFGNVIIQIGGCNSIEQKCVNEISAYLIKNNSPDEAMCKD